MLLVVRCRRELEDRAIKVYHASGLTEGTSSYLEDLETVFQDPMQLDMHGIDAQATRTYDSDSITVL